jgi:hypothetical protein
MTDSNPCMYVISLNPPNSHFERNVIEAIFGFTDTLKGLRKPMAANIQCCISSFD